jgi:hypothetical protein
VLPDVFVVAQLFRKSLAAKNIRMDTNNQDFLLVGAVEDSDPAALRKAARRAPQKIVL